MYVLTLLTIFIPRNKYPLKFVLIHYLLPVCLYFLSSSSHTACATTLLFNCNTIGALVLLFCLASSAFVCGIFPDQDQTHVPYIGRQILTTVPPGKPSRRVYPYAILPQNILERSWWDMSTLFIYFHKTQVHSRIASEDYKQSY